LQLPIGEAESREASFAPIFDRLEDIRKDFIPRLGTLVALTVKAEPHGVRFTSRLPITSMVGIHLLGLLDY